MTISISNTYNLKWYVKDYPNLAITSCGKLINIKTNRIKKICLNGSSIGYWLDSKTFKTLLEINKILIKIHKCPF